MQNSGDNDFCSSLESVLNPLIEVFFAESDYAESSRRAVRSDLRKFGVWFVRANREALDLARVTTRDCADFRDSLRRERSQSVATVNRNLVSLRRFFSWLQDKALVAARDMGVLSHEAMCDEADKARAVQYLVWARADQSRKEDGGQ
jgi:site-specific recombinase XerD